MTGPARRQLEANSGRFFLAAAVGTFLALAFPAGSLASRVIVTDCLYNPVREAPSAASDRLTILGPDIPLWAEDKRGEWYAVRLHDDVVGWVHQCLVMPQAPEVPRPQAEVTGIEVGPWGGGVRVGRRP